MSKKLIYLTSVVLVLSLTREGWPKASNPDPRDGVIFKDTWVTLSWQPSDLAVSFDVYVGINYDDVKYGAGGTYRGNQSLMFFILGFPGYPYPNGLVPGTTYYWRVDEINDQHPDSPSVGDVWSFKIPSSMAHEPYPANGSEFVEPDVTLSWEPGFRALLHTVYFGDNFAEVNNASDGRPRGSTTYSPGLLEPGKTYYWRVDESDGIRTHKGDVWRFTVGAAAIVEQGNIYVDAVNGNDNNNGLTPPTAFATIQKGIDAAENGDIVLVYPGLYLEEINFMGKAITVQGVAVSPAGVPVLWNPGDFAVSFYYGEGPGSILKNFIIKDSFMAIFIADSSPTISNLTIVGNKYGIEAYADSQPDITNCILWNNTDGDLFGCWAMYSCVERGGEGIIADDPLFVDPDNDDYHIRAARGRYWPEHDIWVLDRVTSPCVDAGDTQAEVSNEPVPNGGRINIGAYGGTTEASLSPSELPYRLDNKASNPYPADGAIDVEGDVTLTWTAGLNTVSHDVYFSANIELIAFVDTSDAHGAYRGRQSATSYTPPDGTHQYPYYYWRIDEIDSQGNITKGVVWAFRTKNPPPPQPKGRACFLPETLTMVDGRLVPIRNVAASRTIDSLQEHEGTFVCRDIVLESKNTISVVEAHRFMTDSGKWVAAQNLTTGLRLKTLTGTVGIKSITTRNYTGKVYNLKIRNSEKYMVGKDSVIVRDY
jgi:parallel beta-helix repeat protein